MSSAQRVLVQSASRAYSTHVPSVRKVANRVVGMLFGPQVQVGIRLMDEEEMAELNRTYRGKRGPTDVLSFDSEDPDYAGDLALCVPVALRQARELGHPPSVELAVLTVHGMVHLYGLDHERSHAEAVHQAEVEMGLLSMVGTRPEAALGRRGF